MHFSGTVGIASAPLSIKLTATDSSGLSASETFLATLVAPAPTVAAQTANQTWTAGMALSFSMAGVFSAVTGQTLKYSATLPTGLTINASTGTLGGIVPLGTGNRHGQGDGDRDQRAVGLGELQRDDCCFGADAGEPDAGANLDGESGGLVHRAGEQLYRPAGRKLTYSVTGLPSGLSFNATTLTISGTAPVSPSSSKVTVTAKDQSGLSASETFQATISATPPSAGQTPDQTWTANAAVSLSVASAFSDPQGEKLTYSASLSSGRALPTGLTFGTTTGTFGGIAPTTLGDLAITVTAKDQSGLSVSETFQADVTAAAPTAKVQPAAQLWTVGKAVSFSPAASAFSDPQGEKLTYAATQSNGSALPSWLSFNATTDAFGGTAPITPETLGLTVTATDASGLSASDTISATIQPAAPSLAHQTANQAWSDGSSISFLLPSNTFSDPQGAAMTYAAFETGGSDQTSWMRFEPGSDEFAGTVPGGLTGTIGVKIVATDTYGLSTSESFGLTFGPSGSHLVAVAAPGASELLAFHS